MGRHLEFFDEAAVEGLLAHDELGDGQTNREDGSVLLLALHHPALTCDPTQHQHNTNVSHFLVHAHVQHCPLQ
jgi:hypothetical protein